MPRPARYVEQVEKELRGARRPLTTHEMADKLGCSNQQVHKAVTGPLAGSVVRIGKSPTGGYTYSWRRDESGRSPRAQVSVGVEPRDSGAGLNVELGSSWRVIEVRATLEGTAVTLENDAGTRLTASSTSAA